MTAATLGSLATATTNDVILSDNDAGIVKLATSIDDLKLQMDLFQELKLSILSQHDTMIIHDHIYVKKSGWVKYALAFNLKTEIISETKEIPNINNEDGKRYAYHFVVRCTANNGRYVDKAGTCDTDEKQNDPQHVIRAMAETRATSRAISAMVGAGEVSAEEMEHTQRVAEPTSFEAHARKISNSSSSNNNNEKATEKQIGYLKSMGYLSTSENLTKDEASAKIKKLVGAVK